MGGPNQNQNQNQNHNRPRRVINAPTVFAEDPNRHRHHQVYDAPNHHHPQVYNVPTVFAENPNQQRPPLVFGVPSRSTQEPNHRRPGIVIIAPSVSNEDPSQQRPRAVINVPSATPRATISVVDHNLPYDTHNLYDVTFHSHTIHTLLTSSPSHVDTWLADTLRLNRRRSNTLVGLDVEWRPNTHRNCQNPVATLQLCVGHRCLVFQILHSPFIPQSLTEFLSNACHTFLGVGIEEDVEKLLEDYSLQVANFADLRGLAENVLGEREMRNAGLKRLSARVLGVELEKPQKISRSRWDNVWLTAQQVQYACVDAFVSFEVGRILFRSGNGYGR